MDIRVDEMDKDFQVLHVMDLHLSAKEKRSTRYMVKDSIKMLKELYEYVKDNPKIKLVILYGDLQDTKPTGDNLGIVGIWRRMLKRLEILVRKRRNTLKTLKLYGLTDAEEKAFEAGRYPGLITLKGNHDYLRFMRVDSDDTERAVGSDMYKGYTLFDDFLSEKIIGMPKGLSYTTETQTVYMDLRSYGEADRKLVIPEGLNPDKVEVAVHDTIKFGEYESWMTGLGKKIKGVYDLDEVMAGGAHALYVSHVHTPLEPTIEQLKNGDDVFVWQVGSMGRTSYAKGQIRDYGCCALTDTSDVYYNKHELVEIPVIPASEYFKEDERNYDKQLQVEKSKLLSGLDNMTMTKKKTVKEELEERLKTEPEVLEYCLAILEG